MKAAPFFDDVADGPEGGRAFWLTAEDGLDLRIAVWDGGTRGTVLLFPGRTEYVEKYGRAAADLLRRGYSTIAVDWRGQGLAARLLPDAVIGHISRFADYQRDVAAVMAALPRLGLPEPAFLLAHSMGGCIGLRSVIEGLPVSAAVFCAPMWNISFPGMARPMVRALGAASRVLGLGPRYAPGTSGPEPYVGMAPFDGNNLTTDTTMYAYMQAQVAAYPGLRLGGPSLAWVHEALRESARLARLPSPDLPALTFLGSAESIVCARAIARRMARWPRGQLETVTGARHEVMMETPDTRAAMFDRTCAFFDSHRSTGTA
ncbi:alpha/beta fold hydrolase [Actibacterium sp. D379-3]